MQNNTEKLIIALIVAFLIIISSGVVLNYNSPYHCSITQSSSGADVEFKIESNYNFDYCAVSFVNSDTVSVADLYVYLDSRPSPVDSQHQKDTVDKLISELSVSSVHTHLSDASDMVSIMTDDIAAGYSNSGVVFFSGSLPSEIYDGCTDSLILDWLAVGGSLYWSGGYLGRYVSETDDYYEVTGSDLLFFGESGVIFDEKAAFDVQYHPEDPMGFMGIRTNDCSYGIRTSELNDSWGFQHQYDGYHALSLSRYHGGTGMICVMGGEKVNFDNIIDMAQIIASGFTYSTEVEQTVTGTHIHGMTVDSITRCEGSIMHVFIFVCGNVMRAVSHCVYT